MPVGAGVLSGLSKVPEEDSFQQPCRARGPSCTQKGFGMATERLNRQFILLDFEDLDNPEFMEFVRSPEFSTYLVMRRNVWRSESHHSLQLHEYYAQGLLACALHREKLAAALGGVSARQVTRDINALVNRGIIKAVGTGRGNIFILGKWGRDSEEDIYYEYFFLDKLQSRVDRNVQSEWTSETGQDRPPRVDKNVQSEWTETSSINRESNIESNRDISNLSKGSLDSSSSISSPDEELGEELISSELETFIETCSREFGDMEHLASNLTRAFNLWARTRFDEAEMLSRAQQARDRTKQRIGSSAVRNRQKKMAYFFAVLEDVLGLKDG